VSVIVSPCSCTWPSPLNVPRQAQPLSVQRIKDAISQTFSVSVEVHENAVFDNKEVGDGCIVAILWDKGTVVAFGMGRPTWT
jgi:hypothetical protein